MAVPRVFVSSTFYDLRHMRAALESFVESLGYEPVLFEKGDIPYAAGKPLDESCYAEVGNADVLVLIVGGRYGSKSSKNMKSGTVPGEKVASVTREEFRKADERGIPIYVLVEQAVFAELETYRQNRRSKKVKYAHVDSPEVFEFLEEILGKGKPVFAFSRPKDVEDWLRNQWAGRFRDLILANVSQRPVEGLAIQIDTLKETTRTLKVYLERLVKTVVRGPSGSRLVREQSSRLESRERAMRNPLVRYLVRSREVPEEDVLHALSMAKSKDEFFNRLVVAKPGEEATLRSIQGLEQADRDLDRARVLVNRPPFVQEDQRTGRRSPIRRRLPSAESKSATPAKSGKRGSVARK